VPRWLPKEKVLLASIGRCVRAYFRPVQRKRLLVRWLTGFTAALLLFATSGASLTRMTCLSGGHSTLRIGLVDDCCPEGEENQGPVVKALCCDITQARFDQPSLIMEKQLAMLPSVGIAPLIAVPSAALCQGVRAEWLNSRPPPKDGRARLSLLRTRLI